MVADGDVFGNCRAELCGKGVCSSELIGIPYGNGGNGLGRLLLFGE
jgi:hypothetical protein